MQIDRLQKLPPRAVYENIIKAIDVFSLYASAYPLSNPRAFETAKIITDIMKRHAFLPTIIITDKDSIFDSNMIHDIIEAPDITLRNATTKNTQALGVLERFHSTVETSLKQSPGKFR